MEVGSVNKVEARCWKLPDAGDKSRLGEAKKQVGTAVSDMVGVGGFHRIMSRPPLILTRGTNNAATRRIFQFTRKVHRTAL
ncbi:hypothetical protein EV1_029323 [Malus domestica]